MTSLGITLFHIFAVGESFFQLYIYHVYVMTQIQQGFAGPWKFLTYINMHVQLYSFVLCLLHDLFAACGVQSLKERFARIKDSFYTAIAFPSCVQVFLTFWIIYWVDRELVHPKYLDSFLPPWTNHCWHTTILLTVVELFVTDHKFPSRAKALTMLSIYSLGYLAWLEYVQYKAGIYVYPFVEQMTRFQFSIFCLISMLLFWFLYLLEEYINGKIENNKTKKKAK